MDIYNNLEQYALDNLLNKTLLNAERFFGLDYRIIKIDNYGFILEDDLYYDRANLVLKSNKNFNQINEEIINEGMYFKDVMEYIENNKDSIIVIGIEYF